MYTVKHFIEKFSKIDKDLWTIGTLETPLGDGRIAKCAYGWCGGYADKDNEESTDLLGLFLKYLPFQISYTDINKIGRRISADVVVVNDYKTAEFPQEHPKDRILAALHYIDDKQREEAIKVAQSILRTVDFSTQTEEYVHSSILQAEV